MWDAWVQLRQDPSRTLDGWDPFSQDHAWLYTQGGEELSDNNGEKNLHMSLQALGATRITGSPLAFATKWTASSEGSDRRTGLGPG